MDVGVVDHGDHKVQQNNQHGKFIENKDENPIDVHEERSPHDMRSILVFPKGRIWELNRTDGVVEVLHKGGHVHVHGFEAFIGVVLGAGNQVHQTGEDDPEKKKDGEGNDINHGLLNQHNHLAKGRIGLHENGELKRNHDDNHCVDYEPTGQGLLVELVSHHQEVWNNNAHVIHPKGQINEEDDTVEEVYSVAMHIEVVSWRHRLHQIDLPCQIAPLVNDAGYHPTKYNFPLVTEDLNQEWNRKSEHV